MDVSITEFASKIRARYPEGLTGIFAIGATRRTYILLKQRNQPDAGKLDDFPAYAADIFARYLDLISRYRLLGGTNLIVTALSYRAFFERGPQYVANLISELQHFTAPETCEFYEREELDPYFVGIDTLLRYPADDPIGNVARHLMSFQERWAYQEGRGKLLWEVASIPLYSTMKFFQSAQGLDLAAELETTIDLDTTYQKLYRTVSRAMYGIELPIPHFYLGTSMTGDLKWRSPMPIALTGGEYTRLFYTPYPLLLISDEALISMLEHLAFRDRFHAYSVDYSGRFSPGLVQTEYERLEQVVSDPSSTVGLTRLDQNGQ